MMVIGNFKVHMKKVGNKNMTEIAKINLITTIC